MNAKRDHRLLVVCGETSGEAHAAGVVSHLREMTPGTGWKVFGSGGEKLRAQGAEILLDVSRLSAIGPRAALANLGSYLSLRKQILSRARRERPDLALLVDFPDFNLPLARRLKRMGIPVCYYISPQLWAWRKSRIRQIRKYIDLMLVIFPFEEDFYRKHGVKACYVGNPTAARLAAFEIGPGTGDESGKPVVALLPGSRAREVELLLPLQLEAADWLSREVASRFLVFRAPEIQKSQLEKIVDEAALKDSLDLEIVDSDYNLLSGADCALVKSGTSTLETMLLGVPFAMVYRLPLASYLLLRPFVRTDTFCLANLVAEEKIVPEFIQGDATGEALGGYLKSLMEDRDKHREIREKFSKVKAKLGTRDGSARAAEKIVETFLSGTGI